MFEDNMTDQDRSTNDFEIQECKLEPCFDLDNTNEYPLEFDKSSTLHISVPTLMIKTPVIYLERCDKIWETLQLIKTVQNKSPREMNDHEEEEKTEEEEEMEEKNEKQEKEIKEKEEAHLKESKKIVKDLKIQPGSKDNNTMSLPFQFSVQRIKKLYPCTTCGKQYMERRSLRKHAERVHGIIIPLLFKRKHFYKTSKTTVKDSSISPSNKGNSNSDKLNKDLYKKTATETIELNPSKRSKSMVSDTNCIDGKFTEIESSPEKTGLSRCVLCRQKVKSVRKHLIHYHKVGCSSSMMKQLESTLLKENETPSQIGNRKNMLRDILSGKFPEASVNENTQDNDESKTYRMPEIRKRKYASSYANTGKKPKLDVNNYKSAQNISAIMKKYLRTRSTASYKCDICLGMYSSSNSFAKHRRIHAIRGETKENFNILKCRYFNSPLNKKFQALFAKLNESADQNTSDDVNRDLQIINSKQKDLLTQNGNNSGVNKATTYNGKMRKNNDTICTCGRSFRNPHTLFIHKTKCKQQDAMVQRITRNKSGNNTDPGIGFNITIKKKNNSYEIVGKDNEDNAKKSDNSKDDTLLSNVSDCANKESTNGHAESQQINESKYSKDHSILKLQVAEEDVIIDIENEVEIVFDKGDKAKQEVAQVDDKDYSQKEQNDGVKNMKNEADSTNIPTLKEMCQEVLNESSITGKSENGNTTRIIQQQNRRSLRSSNKNHQNAKKKYNHLFDDIETSTSTFNPLLTCGYCNKEFNTNTMYNKHQCTVKEGKNFEDFSLQLLCFCCNDILKSCTEFDEHMNAKHFDRAYYCFQCPSRFVNEKQRNLHVRMEHRETSCTFCNKKITTSVRALHESYHLGFGYPCHKCKKAYSHKRKLLYHNSTIHMNGADNTVICNICLKSVKLKTFRRHMYKHNHNKCHFCDKVFAGRTGMEYHTLTYHRGTHSKLRYNNRKFS